MMPYLHCPLSEATCLHKEHYPDSVGVDICERFGGSVGRALGVALSFLPVNRLTFLVVSSNPGRA